MTPDELIHAQLDVLMEGIAELVAERDALREQVRVLREALEIYANPDFYFACSFFFDRPTGGFDEDFDYDEQYERDMPGKIARAALAATKEKP